MVPQGQDRAILVVVDGSRSSVRAVEVASVLARREGALLTVLYLMSGPLLTLSHVAPPSSLEELVEVEADLFLANVSALTPAIDVRIVRLRAGLSGGIRRLFRQRSYALTVVGVRRQLIFPYAHGVPMLVGGRLLRISQKMTP
jgi:nucleotide-binding universal stress UspA family protein